LKSITNYGILYRRKDNIDLKAFMDVDWASNLELKRSINATFSKLETHQWLLGMGIDKLL
jgi:hypothetical protein